MGVERRKYNRKHLCSKDSNSYLRLFESSLLYVLGVLLTPHFGRNASKALIFIVKLLLHVDILLVSNLL